MPATEPGPDSKSESDESSDRSCRENDAVSMQEAEIDEISPPSFDEISDVGVDPAGVSIRTTATDESVQNESERLTEADHSTTQESDGGADAQTYPKNRRDAETAGTAGETEGTPDDASATGETFSAEEYITRVHELVYSDPVAAGDRIGDLLVLAKNGEPALQESIDVTLEWLGDRRPQEFGVWADDLAGFASSPDPKLAVLGLRSLAQLAPHNEAAAKKGLSAAVRCLDAAHTELQRAALALVAEVGGSEADTIGDADRSIAAALSADAASVRTAAAIAAGNLLRNAPQRFPRTSMALVDAVDDPDETVREYVRIALVSFATVHPSNVPEAETVVGALESYSDRDLGLRQGATAEAANQLLKRQAGYR